MNRRDADAAKLVERLRELGFPDAEELASAFAAGDRDSVARALIVHQIWVNEIDAWRDSAENWIARELAEARDPEWTFSDAGRALKRIIDAGASVEDIGRLARAVAYSTAFGVLYGLGRGLNDPDIDDIWDILDIEEDALLIALRGLHEDLLMGDPSGRQGRPAPGE